jgi:hypothetical protein
MAMVILAGMVVLVVLSEIKMGFLLRGSLIGFIIIKKKT